MPFFPRCRRTAVAHRAVSSLALILAIACLLAPSPARAAKPDVVVKVSGHLTDSSGAPIPGQTVRIMKTRTIYSVKAPRSTDQLVEETRTRTDADGAFGLEVTLDRSFHGYFVRFYDPNMFDVVKYVLPRDQEISRAMESGGPVEAHAVLNLQPTWPQVKALVEEYGAASPRGQILRSLGLPTRKEPEADGRELWVFEDAGVAYVIAGEKVAETRKVVKPDSAAIGTPATDAPRPAERVDER